MSGVVFLILRLGLTLGLYAFLFWALFTLWRDLQGQVKGLSARQPPPITLLRLVGAETVPLRFAGPEVIIGRDPVCDCVLNDNTVSAQHVRLSYRQGQWWVEDLRSTNGTFLNLERVVVPLVVTSGDQLRCGQEVFTILIGDQGR